MEIIHWQINPNLEKSVKESYRTNFAINLKDEDALTIVRELSFDGVAPNITFADIEKIFNYVNKYFLDNKIKGIGLEVGAGCGVFSSILAKNDLVKRMYAVEICGKAVGLLMRKVAREILGEKENKVIGCVGDFNHIELEDESVDFIFDFFSLHHSDDLIETLTECCRILKEGGFVFCFDKARPDSHTEEDIRKMLDKEYNEDSKRRFGFPPDKKLTRRMNGEREYRLKDWKKSFNKAGFSKVSHYNLCKTFSSNYLIGFLKYVLLGIPPKFHPIFTRIIKKESKKLFAIARENRVYSSFVNPFPKEISLIIAYK